MSEAGCGWTPAISLRREIRDVEVLVGSGYLPGNLTNAPREARPVDPNTTTAIAIRLAATVAP